MKYIDYFGLSSTIDENCGCVNHGHPGWYNAPLDCICICGRDGSEYAAGSYRGKIGSDIKSAIRGISYGVVDFVVDSIHDLQTAAVYMGAGELELSIQERMQIIEAVEQSQANQMATIEDWMMDMLSVDSSDTVYQSFHSKTTLGLEVGSLVAGGYGAVKGIIAFNKLAKAPMQASRIVRTEGVIVKSIGTSNKIWSTTKQRSSVKNAFIHWQEHAADFPELLNAKQYAESAKAFINNPPTGTLTKIRANGDIILYHPTANSFAISNVEGLPRTMYKPSLNRHPYSTNLEYFNAQK